MSEQGLPNALQLDDAGDTEETPDEYIELYKNDPTADEEGRYLDSIPPGLRAAPKDFGILNLQHTPTGLFEAKRHHAQQHLQLVRTPDDPLLGSGEFGSVFAARLVCDEQSYPIAVKVYERGASDIGSSAAVSWRKLNAEVNRESVCVCTRLLCHKVVQNCNISQARNVMRAELELPSSVV
jgi:hypothetical protein